jgi:hypothetical protein
MKENRVAKSNSGIGLTLFLLFALILVNFNHNVTISKSTNSRDFIYASWEVLTQKTNFFSELKSEDSIVSSTSNDAYEMNAGSFYANTGIRLSYLFNAGIVWPNFITCHSSSKCELGNIDSRLNAILPNLLRENINSKQNLSADAEWVAKILRSGNQKHAIYYLDRIPFTNEQIAYVLAPITIYNPTAIIDSSRLRFAIVSKTKGLPWKPEVRSTCAATKISTNAIDGIFVTTWKFEFSKNQIDLRDLALKTCPN